ncbi:MAG: SUMF1/EgtB/PvdO family nonheme iron enzyme [Kiritimatiellae bacterium]|nr:SUMF1/EgtB/PvdO family nonheme iron enzyme [Kiritimatiellia bacterium]
MLDKEATTEEWLRGHTPIGNGASLPDGTEVGRWRIVAFVARGGSGEVYRAVEVDGQRMAALKILHRTDAAAVARFAREVQVLSELRDRAFPVFFESGTFGGRPWYATEFLQPLDMPATDRAVARFIVAVCRGAGALHARGFVHRDIKPANILFRKDEPVLIDLGLLKKAETPALHTGGTVSVVDGRPVGVGTPGYAAPEQFMGGEISPAADIHAIGVLASVCFGGRPPRAWRAIIRRATSSLPGERYPDVAALARAVRLRHLPTTLGAAAVAVALATGAAVLWSNGVRSSARDAAMETRETAPSIPSPPSASPLAQAFAAVAESAFDPDWANDYRATLAAVEQASKTPGDIPDSLVQRLVFESKNGICNIDQGGIVFQISSYNKRYPSRAKPMPKPSDFAPLLTDMLTRRNTREPLVRDEYLAFRRKFFGIVGMELQSVFNRLVVAVFPEQFVPPADSAHLAKCQGALTARHYISPIVPETDETAWFERSEHIVQELRSGLSGVSGLEPAMLARFVWVVGLGNVEAAPPPTQPEVEPNPATPPASNPQTEEQPKAPVPESTPRPALEPTSEFAPKSKRGHVSDDEEPIIASERLRNKLADQGRNLPNVTPNQIRNVLEKLDKGMVPIPGRDFEMCKFELTQSIWEPIAGFNPSKEKGPDIPVSNVTMADIEEFLENLNDLPEVRASGRKYRLPTAEEWEYACLAGGTNGFCRLADGTQITPETLGEVAWFAGNSNNRPHPVCAKAPNAFGLYDMHGNVAEFTSSRRPNDMFEYIWKGNAYNGEKPNGFRADLSPSLTYGISYYIAGFRLAR